MKGLTKRQLEIVSYINEFITTHRYSPSLREIMHHFGFSSLGTIHKHLHALKRKGYLEAEKNCGRSLSLAAEMPSKEIKLEVELPFIGQIKAGSPIETFSQMRTIAVPQNMVSAPQKTYVLRAMGDSLSEEMIADGDLLLVEARPEAHAGEMVVALINHHDIIIKKYYPDGPYVRLTGNAHQKPIILRLTDIEIQGVLVGLLRFYG